jgi:hypothetical protein
MMDRWQRLSRASKVVLAMGTVLLVFAWTGWLQADRGLQVDATEAVEIASQHVDFEPEQHQVRLLRQGVGLRPVWAVSLSIPIEQTATFERLAVVEVDAFTGQVLRVTTER